MEKIRICHVTSVHNAKDARIFYKECCSLAKEYETTIIAPNINDHYDNGVNFVGVQLPQNRFRRLFSLNQVYAKALQVNAEIYHFHDPELQTLGLKLKKNGKIIIFDSHEDVPMQILTKEWIPCPFRIPMSSIYSFYEKRNLKKYDALVSVTPTITNRLKGINPHTYQVTNYPEYQDVGDCRKWGKKICFTGGISEKYMHHNILKAIEDIDVTYVLAGWSNPYSYFEKIKTQKGWDKVDYRGSVKREECIDIMQECMAGLAILDYLPNVGFHKGTLGVLKIFEYMQAGIPVIATDFDLWKEIIEENNCGICVNPNNIDEIKKAITYFIENPEDAKQKGNNGKKVVKEKYTWESQKVILLKMYHDLINLQK